MDGPIDGIETRLHLIQAALRKTVLVKFEHGKEEIGGGGYRMRFPFDEPPMGEDLVVNVYAVIGALANLKDLLKTWAKEHGKDPQRVEVFVKAHRSAARPRPEQRAQARVPTDADSALRP